MKSTADKSAESVELAISGMRCAGCADSIAAALRAVPGVVAADVSEVVGLARVVGARLDAGTLVAAVAGAGYVAAPSGALADQIASRRERRAVLQAAVLAAVAWSGLVTAAWGSALLAAAALTGPGRGFLVGAAIALKRWRGTMDLLVAIGATAAALLAVLVAAGWLPVALDHGHAAVALILFLRVGKWLEANVKARTSARLWSLLDVLPARARRCVEGGAIGGSAIEEVAASALSVGDTIEARAGERLPADGIVIAGRSSVEVAALTGEPLPVDVAPGAAIAAGALVLQAPLRVRVTAAGGASQLGQMAAVVRKALLDRAPIATLAERVAAWFVPSIVLLAIATALGWWWVGGDAATIVGRALATVVVSCPCALALATPAALVAGTAAALARGIVVKEAGALEALARVRVALLDKTGTLTRGVLTAEAPRLDRTDAMQRELVRALASASRHAAARAVAETLPPSLARDPPPPLMPLLAVEEIAGLGVRARHAGHEWRLGRVAFASAPEQAAAAIAAPAAFAAIAAMQLPDAASAVAFSCDGDLLAVWTLTDTAKPTARAAISALAAAGLEVGLVTGDRAAAASSLAREVGIAPEAVHAECTPATKAALVQEHEARGLPVLFVGDGFNDGAALAVATVGAACGGEGATELARAAGRIVLLRGDPQDAAVAVAIGRKTLRIVRQNLVLAVAYNAVALPWAMGLLARFGVTAPEPAHAGLAMAASSLAVVLNALRLAPRS
ncbi:MAG: cation-translocating P-type ATPase [Planctomycetes bacterium]|nr:cation-translocating P-type ATPase [Planctomycetota bacterium]